MRAQPQETHPPCELFGNYSWSATGRWLFPPVGRLLQSAQVGMMGFLTLR